MSQSALNHCIHANVHAALEEDIGEKAPTSILPREQERRQTRKAIFNSGDLTAQLIPEHARAYARVVTRQAAVLCGSPWFEECFLSLDPDCHIKWLAQEGQRVEPGQTLCEIQGNARAMLSAERPALNFLQTFSATATLTQRYVEAVAGTRAKIMDTRKTLPGLRVAQKYAVRVGGGHNQRTGLSDGVLIKENHISAAGSIHAVLEQAFRITPPGTPIQIEVENMVQFEESLNAGARLILLDNFPLADMRIAVAHAIGRAELEASGGVTLENVCLIAETGVDRISVGALTKDVQAVDLSMRFALQPS
ncbi:MAG TPA: carboxylating nicotinate-nucleotide diphosphorylase [Gallionella sp.]|jgi:nicotinate-nucleotide pyrophosphorylase (carboxylating)|nr:carboxylating nicotinate-nucleotide diphosphorylase [Gallionella sp.]